MVSRKSIVQYCEGIAQEFKPERIILFGSYAYGKPRPDSDVDILIILRHRGNSISKAVDILRKRPAPFAVDLLVRNPGDYRKRIRLGDWFLREIDKQGLVVYESPDR